MTAGKSLVRAEGKDTQEESQEVFERYQREFGIGATSSSPAAGDVASQRQQPKKARTYGKRPVRTKPAASFPASVQDASGGVPVKRAPVRPGEQCRNGRVLAPPHTTSLPPIDAVHNQSDENVDLPDTQDPVAHEPPAAFLAQLSSSDASKRPSRNMDGSQSPTQSNEGRSYEQYVRTSPIPSNADDAADDVGHDTGDEQQELSQDGSLGDKTYGEDDSGAVRFDIHQLTEQTPFKHDSNVLPSASPLKYVGGFAPETPAAPRNPFAAASKAPLLAGSQMFGQTQFSSAVKHISPTSSRPSPNAFNHNPINSISPNPVSSPIKNRGLGTSPMSALQSSPRVLPGTSSRPHDDDNTPYNSGSTKGGVIPDSPRYCPPKTSSGPGPLGEYEPMKKSQERREASALEDHAGTSDSDDDLRNDSMARRLRARAKKHEAEKQLTSISFARPPRPQDVEVPSTNRKRRKRRSQAEEYVAQCLGKHPTSDVQGNTVTDSQDRGPQDAREQSHNEPVEDDARSTASSVQSVTDQRVDTLREENNVLRNTPDRLNERPPASAGPPTQDTDKNQSSREAIPETSPINGHIRPFKEIRGESSSSAPSRSVSIPRLSTSQDNDLMPSPKPVMPSSRKQVSSGTYRSSLREIAVVAASEAPDKVLSSPRLPDITQASTADASPQMRSSPPPPPAPTTRPKRGVAKGARAAKTQVVPTSSSSAAKAKAPPSSTSALSSLSSTPRLSTDTTTPLTQDSGGGRNHAGEHMPSTTDQSSPALAKVQRKETIACLPKLKTSTIKSHSRGKSRDSVSTSTDELARSISPVSAPGFEHSLRAPRAHTSRLAKQNIKNLQAFDGQRTPSKLFSGMSFAISFQSKKPGHSESEAQYNQRMDFAKLVEKKISQAGGLVLSNGFEELFEISPIRSAVVSPSPPFEIDSTVKLAEAARATGFAALIADGHSRKVKYMQALALGIPCLAPRWVTMCIDKGEIVDWTPFLLCAGVSKFLGDAIRSRTLPSYPAATAKLEDILEKRPRLLADRTILLVMKKSKSEEKKMAYVFLARVLGASLSRVYNVEEARAKLKQAEDAGHPFDWVYLDENTEKANALFVSAPSATKGREKKRKRASTATDATPATKKIRTLSDELVIQSLILGRMIEEDEMDV